MLVAGFALLLTGIAYYFLTEDTRRWRWSRPSRAEIAERL